MKKSGEKIDIYFNISLYKGFKKFQISGYQGVRQFVVPGTDPVYERAFPYRNNGRSDGGGGWSL